jgi:hypothetical protein
MKDLLVWMIAIGVGLFFYGLLGYEYVSFRAGPRIGHPAVARLAIFAGATMAVGGWLLRRKQ